MKQREIGRETRKTLVPLHFNMQGPHIYIFIYEEFKIKQTFFTPRLREPVETGGYFGFRRAQRTTPQSGSSGTPINGRPRD